MILIEVALFLLILNTVNGQYQNGFGPRIPDSPPADFIDRLTKNRQVPPNAAIITQAQPIERPPYTRNGPIYIGSIPASPPYSPPAQRPVESFDVDLSSRDSSAFSPFSDRNRLFGINPPSQQNYMRPVDTAVGQIYKSANSPRIETVSSDLHVSLPNRPVKQIQSMNAYAPNYDKGHQVDIPMGFGAPREIGRFDTNVDRFATDEQFPQKQRVFLPAELANAPMDAFLRRLEPNQQVRPVVGTQPANANTRILIAPELTKPPQTTTSSSVPFGQGHTLPPEKVTPFTTYPNLRNDLFPQLVNHAHDDKRPATGRRVGPQGTFGGGTNEYREDLGKITSKGINDQRRPWELLPYRFEQQGNRPPNQDRSDVYLENLRDRALSRADGRGFGDDLSITDRYAGIPMGRFGPEYPEFTTKTPESRETTTLIGASYRHPEPLYPEDGIRYRGQQGNGPASQSIGNAFNIPDVATRVRVPESGMRELDDGIRPYRGPEEITLSRYRDRSDALGGRGRAFKLDLLNE
ncbi:hypothetical protein M3Y98_00585900 [Aphelenchoides besseyi]|nr:hypothetical protein M3Y98_00585900 [Aphelenchoides besseyi]